ncbi:MAG: hypothetical protein H6832_09220 [Planctomycetes bacterium]|nr:hypothetical protein [Planctomycetota bacterium]
MNDNPPAAKTPRKPMSEAKKRALSHIGVAAALLTLGSTLFFAGQAWESYRLSDSPLTSEDYDIALATVEDAMLLAGSTVDGSPPPTRAVKDSTISISETIKDLVTAQLLIETLDKRHDADFVRDVLRDRLKHLNQKHTETTQLGGENTEPPELTKAKNAVTETFVFYLRGLHMKLSSCKAALQAK